MARFDEAFRHATCETPFRPRAPEPHLSSIVRGIALRARLLKPDDPDEAELTIQRRHLLWSLGFAWEWVVAQQHPAMLHQPGEIIRDGIAMNPDGVTSFDDVEAPPPVTARSTCRVLVDECKLTQLSSNRDLRYKWIWMSQGKAYARALGTLWVRWHVCYMRGDYRGSGPIYKVFWVKFTRQELEVNWGLIVRNKENV